VQRGVQDANDATESKAALSEALGGDAQLGVALDEIGTFLDDPERISPELADGLAQARLPDGRRLMNDPGFALLLLGFAKATGEERVDDAVEVAESMVPASHRARSHVGGEPDLRVEEGVAEERGAQSVSGRLRVPQRRHGRRLPCLAAGWP